MNPVFAWLCTDEDGTAVLLDYKPEFYLFKTIKPIIYQEVDMFVEKKQ